MSDNSIFNERKHSSTRLNGGRSLTRKWVAVLLSIVLVAAACGSDDDSQMDLTLAGSSTSSSVYGFLLTHARQAGQDDGAITINVRESSTIDNPGLVKDGSVDYAIAGLNALARSYKGTGQYEGNPNTDSRLLMTYLTVAEMLVVRSDKGISRVQDLEGMPFAPSMQGSPIYTKVLEMFDALGITVDVFDGALEDVVSAMKDNRIVGFGKAGAGKVADASMLDAASAVPVTLVGFTDQDIATIQAVHPNFNFTEVPAGALLDSPAVKQSTIDAVYFTSASMSEGDAYRLTKALWTTLQSSADESGYKASSGIVAEQTVEASRLVPLHPGAERYFREIGVLD